VAVCDDCMRELFDPGDRRYGYPFINCTNCGPRYTIIEDIPYDRPKTSMRSFGMCPRCQAEYDNPADRRFHAQPNACADCGPRVTLTDRCGQAVEGDDPIAEAAGLISAGHIVAVKGLGGYHLAVDAVNDDAVQRLRQRKRREEKPFAVMTADPETIGSFAQMDTDTARLLGSIQRPIVLLPKRLPERLAFSVAPRNHYYGVMLAYTPLHYLLLSHGPKVLVMTSANLSEEPIVIDNKLCCARFIKHGTDGASPDHTIGTLVSWGNHPEALGGSNPLLTSDFCHYWREGVEKGVPEPNGVEALGGMCLYFQGMIGGLMTQLHTTVPHRNGIDKFSDETFEKAQALGENLAIVTCKALRGPTAWKNENPRVGVAAKTFYAPMAGLFKVAITLGLLHPGVYWGFKARSEVNVIRIGDVEILTAPGELYPEIADGGVEALPGRDFPLEPQEVPALRRDVMKGKMNLVVGLANDEIGYMIPKSQWDAKAPFVYDNKDQYGEENSGGPEVGRVYHQEALALLNRVHEAWDKASGAQ